ncbi:MAG TPA: zf-HC2 domain-containing protein [Polyangiaceae bacterium]|nr:zf-HC2 domain-containing protein [Polyangiaceae bacterium]
MSEKPVDLSCQQLVELVDEYLAQSLTLEARQAFDVHLETCPPCSTYLEQMKTVLTLAGALGKARAPGDVEPQLLALFEQWRERSTS